MLSQDISQCSLKYPSAKQTKYMKSFLELFFIVSQSPNDKSELTFFNGPCYSAVDTL